MTNFRITLFSLLLLGNASSHASIAQEINTAAKILQIIGKLYEQYIKEKTVLHITRTALSKKKLWPMYTLFLFYLANKTIPLPASALVSKFPWGTEQLGGKAEKIFTDTNGQYYALKYIFPQKPKLTKTKRAFLYVPGFLDHPHWGIALLHHVLFPSQEVYVALFEDGRNNCGFQVGFGGTDEIKSLLLLLKAISEMKNEKGKNKYNSFGIVANSRGGGVAKKTIAFLNAAKTDAEKDAYLKSLGIDEIIRNRILEMLGNGCLVPRVPLKDMGQTIMWRCQNMLKGAVHKISGENKNISDSWIVTKTSNFIGYPLGHLCNYVIAPLLTWFRYNPLAPSPLEEIKHLHGLNLKTLVYHTKDDEVIGNELDEEYVKKLQEAFDTDEIKLVQHEFYLGNHTAANPELPEFSEYVKTIREFLAQ